MKRLVLAAAMATMLALACTGRAEARIFEPQHNWWNSGRTCSESRNPPGLAWDDLPHRACVARDQSDEPKRTEAVAFEVRKPDLWAVADKKASATI